MGKKNVFFILLFIMVLALGLRINAFWSTHWKGDQNHYAVLAMKLDKQGLAGYNLREVRTGRQTLSKDPLVEMAFCRLASPGEEGDILRTLRLVGQGYYNEPLHYRAPLFSAVLMFSHRLFAAREPFYGLCSANATDRGKILWPAEVFRAQFWAVIVPLFFNLALIGLTFWMGARLFDEKTGLVAAFLMATNPISFFLAHKLLVEDMMTFFLTLSLCLYSISFRKKNYLGVTAAGVFAGLAMLSKQTAGLILPVVWFYSFLDKFSASKKIRHAFAPEFLCFAAAVFCVSGFWFFHVWQVYGTLFHQPGSLLEAMKNDKTGWFRAVTSRPPPLFFFSLGVLFLSPFFSFMFLSARAFYTEIKHALQGTRVPGTGPSRGAPETFLWLWVLVFYLFLTEPWQVLALTANQEHRFFYPAYPALVLLAAAGWGRLTSLWNQTLGVFRVADLVLIALLACNALWGIRQAVGHVFGNNLLF